MARRRTPAPPAPPPADERRNTGRRIDALPAWLSAVAALAGVLLTALVIFGLVRDPDTPPPTSTPPAVSTPGGAAPRVTLETVLTGPEEVSAEGRYENIVRGRETILFIGQPADDTTATWLPVEAELFPDSGAAAGAIGRWQAVRPGVDGRYRWYAVVAPAVPGAGGSLEDLSRNGPESEYVRAASEVRLSD